MEDFREEFQETVEVKVKVKVEPEEENETNPQESLSQFVKERRIRKSMSLILNEPQEDEWANDAFEPGQVELNFNLKEEWLTENEQDSITNANSNTNQVITTEAQTETTSLTPFQIPAPIPIPAPEQICSFCGKKFLTLQQLKYHFRIHDQKKYKCPLCDYATPILTNLKNHQVVHTGEKPWKCPAPNCGMSFTQKQNLQRHKFTVHKFKMFRCSICSFKTIRQSRLTNHVKIHELKNLECSESAVQIPDKGPEVSKLVQAKAIRKNISSSSSLSLSSTDLVVKILNKEPEPKSQPESSIKAVEFYSENHHKEEPSKPALKSCTIFYHCDNCDFFTKNHKQLAAHHYKKHNLPRVILKKYKILQSRERKMTEDENSSLGLNLQSSTQTEEEIVRWLNAQSPSVLTRVLKNVL